MLSVYTEKKGRETSPAKEKMDPFIYGVSVMAMLSV